MKRRPNLLALLLALVPAPALAQAPAEPGVMLREGTWDGDIGGYEVPAAFSKLRATQWPGDGWYRIHLKEKAIEVAPMATPTQRLPAFLQGIVSQRERVEKNLPPPGARPPDPLEWVNAIFLRVPGVRLREGAIAPYVFRNGTTMLSPILDHRYELALDGQPFAFSVRNGLRGNDGRPYGDGAHYAIEYGGERYEYALGEYGWDSRVSAIVDLDGDGKPDFVIAVGGNNSSYEAVLLSSTARPGPNVPTASLRAMGC